MFHKRRLIAFICLVALLLAALTPVASSPCYAVVLTPVDPLFGFVVIAENVPVDIVLIGPYRFPLLEITGSRPPPTL